MARESIKARQRKREKMVAQYAEKRAALKAAGDQAGLDKLPRNASPVRLKNRCQLTGRPKGTSVISVYAEICFAIWPSMEKYQVLKRPAGN